MTVEATANDSNADVEYLDENDAALTDADDTKAGFQVDLDAGENVVKAKVTAEDGSTTETYDLAVFRAGETLVSNLLTPVSWFSIDQSERRAQRFVTGDETADLLTVQLRLRDLDEGDEKITVSLYSRSASNRPDSLLGTFRTPAFGATSANITARNLTFTALTPIGLSANTHYFIVISADSGDFDLQMFSNNNEHSSSRDGWSIANGDLESVGSTWIGSNASFRMILTGTNIVTVASDDATLSDLTLEDSSDDSRPR